MKQHSIILISVFFMLYVATSLQAAQAAQIVNIVEVVKALPRGMVHHQPPAAPAPVPKVAAKAVAKDNDADRRAREERERRELLEEEAANIRLVQEFEQAEADRVAEDWQVKFDREENIRIAENYARAQEADRRAQEQLRVAAERDLQVPRNLQAKNRALDEAKRRVQEAKEPKAVVQDIVQDVTCVVCQDSIADLTSGNKMMATNCCQAPICQNDFYKMEKVAIQDYDNYHNLVWRSNHAKSADFGTDPAFPGGWSSEEMQNRKEAACPNCKNYPLKVHDFDVEDAECFLCAEERPANEFRQLECGHQYCDQCLAHMLDDAIRDKSTEALRCPECQTRSPFTEVDIRNIRNLQRDVDAIAAIQTQEWLRTQPNAKQCPTANCGNVFLVEPAEPAHQMQCPSCEQKYCIQCLMQHDPKITCARAKAMRVTDDQATAKLIQQISKPCPSCKAPIQKTEGCAHMTCKCKHNFCWNCLGDWGNYGYVYHNQFGSECRPLEIIRARIVEAQANLVRSKEAFRINPTDPYRGYKALLDQTELQCLRADEQKYLQLDQAKRAQALAATAIDEEDLWNLSQQPKQVALNADEYFAKQAKQVQGPAAKAAKAPAPKQAAAAAKAVTAETAKDRAEAEDRAEYGRMMERIDGYALR